MTNANDTMRILARFMKGPQYPFNQARKLIGAFEEDERVKLKRMERAW